jgi:hemerythrin superfamily protein
MRRQPKDAISLLTADHKHVQGLFKQFEKLSDEDTDRKAQIVSEACAELTVHATLEEEIFYPAMREALEEQDVLDESEVEHATAKELIAQLQSMKPGEDLFDAKFTVLGEYVNHHIKEEQRQLFPKAKKGKVDLKALGEELLARKEQCRQEMGLGESSKTGERVHEEHEEQRE